MKISITMTKEEKKKVLDQILFDPCEHINCADVNCNQCPLHEAVVRMREAIDNLDNVIDCIPIEGE